MTAGELSRDARQVFMRAALAVKPKPSPAGKPKFLGPPAAVVPFSDWNYYYTRDPLEWHSDTDTNHKVSVPIGFVTDLASIPSAFWTLLPKTASYTYAAIIHDYLYWTQPCSREDADNMLKAVMEELKVAELKIVTIYQGVRFGGEASWTNNAAAKAKGEKRVLKLFPTDMKISWEQWKIEPDVFA
ncbi:MULTISPECIES: DUF1353 domain-containing protein [Mesorhizobium]|uniref:DUF1353 domain-containing protein n=1 Tax=Mesorhizobium shonense TaxID=1209948 RepID=A0ABV2HZQ9_9HYPH|nr:DUF1353 domain-containing protein [Mesorhizobium sp.]RWB21992.1 MAG: DUF1353 domain-containing protein [Mesorhizobium sp.]RWE02340.1 MAG: DUF1353 domain-containing protein [Mesorhizobium sp.]TIS48688.1 MAG: DUF1353 domain-containing protein [Mesorhizobium sp.]TIT89455.1 MAG: DUF1353 domain-containing protein [Mesorhizobium sp.]